MVTTLSSMMSVNISRSTTESRRRNEVYFELGSNISETDMQ